MIIVVFGLTFKNIQNNTFMLLEGASYSVYTNVSDSINLELYLFFYLIVFKEACKQTYHLCNVSRCYARASRNLLARTKSTTI